MTIIPNTQAAIGKVQKYSPLSAYVAQFISSVNAIAHKVYVASAQSLNYFAHVGDKMALVGVVFVPLRVYNIVKIVKSNDTVKRKTIDIIIEAGGVFNGGVVVVSFLKKNIKEVIPALPYLVGVSALFQAVDVYKKAALLHQTKQTLRGMENNDPLREKVRRNIISQKVLLTASVVEFLASSLTLSSFFVAPPVAFGLGVANACILGSTSAAKIAMFIYDHKTKKI